MKKIFRVRANKALWFPIDAKAEPAKEDCMSVPDGIGWAIYELFSGLARKENPMTTRSTDPSPTMILAVEAK